MTQLEELTKPLTRKEIEAAIYASIEAQGASTTNWKPGSVVRTLIAGYAVVLAAFSAMIAVIVRAGWRKLSKGKWLDLVAFYVYGLTRRDPTFAAGVVSVSNGAGGVYGYDAGEASFVNARTGARYVNVAGFEIDSNQQDVSVSIRAVDAGSGASAFPGEISRLEGGPIELTVTNHTAILALDEESDLELDRKCGDSLGGRSSMGPKDAYRFAAVNAKRADGTPIGVTKARVVTSINGVATVYVATVSGPVTPADLPFVAAAVERATPIGFTTVTAAARERVLNVTYDAAIHDGSGHTESQLKAAILKAISRYVVALPIGGDVLDDGIGRLYLNTLRIVASLADDDDGKRLPTIRVVLDEPSRDLVLEAGEVVTLGSVTGTVTFYPASVAA